MRKTLGITLTTAALLFGGAGVANATTPSAPVPSSTTVVADNGTTYGHDHSDKTGLWGLLGLLGLVGLAGLKRRNNADVGAGPAAHGPSSPRV